MVTALPTPPSSARPATFNADMDTFLAALPVFQVEINAALAALGSLNLVPAANKIINGGMVLDQRNAGASVTPASGTYTIDRWYANQSVASKFSVQQNGGSLTAPSGKPNWACITSLSSYAVGAGEAFTFAQAIEGLNIADLQWGTANARAVTLSFLVLSTLTGNFGGSVQCNGHSRSYPFSYNIPVANTWTVISVTIPGDTAGTWLTTNGLGLAVYLGLGCGTTLSGPAAAWAGTNYYVPTGSVSVVGTNGAKIAFTAVKLEIGSTATPYVEDDYAILVQKCQRYFNKWNAVTGNSDVAGLAAGFAWATTHAQFAAITHPVQMRTAPTFSVSAAADFSVALSGDAAVALSAIGATNTDTRGASLTAVTTASASLTLGTGVVLCQHSNTAWYYNDAEL